MIGLLIHFAEKLAATCTDILPIVAVLVGFQLLIIRRPLQHFKRTVFGFMFVVLGVVFFLEGLETALFPLGNLMAAQLTSAEFLSSHPNHSPYTWQTYNWVYIFAACIGFTTALAEPALLAVALKAEEISGGTIRPWGLRIAVALGVSAGLALGTFRIVSGLGLYYFIVAGYVIVSVQTIFSPRAVIGLAYDTGGVTTSMVTVPLVTALGLGLAQAIPGRNPVLDGFGLIAFASLFPIISVLSYAQLAHLLHKKSIQS